MREPIFKNISDRPLELRGPDGVLEIVPPGGQVRGEFYRAFSDSKALPYPALSPLKCVGRERTKDEKICQ
jgi:hypothetical protein